MVSPPQTSTHQRPADAAPARLSRFLGGALCLALLLALVDVVATSWGAAKRPYGWRLPVQTAVTHALLAMGLALVVGALVLAVRKLARRPAPRPGTGAGATGFAYAAGAYLFLFGGYFRFSAKVTRERDPGLLFEPASLLIVAVLLIVSLAATAGLLRLLSTERLARLPFARRPATAQAVVLAAFALLATLALALRPSEEPVSASSAPVSALPSGVRNVLWIVMDTTRRDRMTVYDPALETTPNLARLADEGAVFEAASSSSTFTLSSHASMVTGLSPSGHNATLRTQWLAQRHPTLALQLGQAGLRTAAFVANRVIRLETGMDLGFDHYDDLVDPELCYTTVWSLIHDVQATLAHELPAFRNDGRPHWIEDHQRSAGEENQGIAAWLDANADAPFFLFVNYYDVHWPYLPAEPWRSRFVGDYDGPMTGFLFRDDDYQEGYVTTPEDDRYLLSLYDAELAQLDHELDALLGELRGRGLLDDTLVVITADHGEHFGERGKHGHDELYEQGLAVPIILRLPGVVPAGLRVPDAVQVADLFPTVLDLAGLEIPPGLSSRSLVPLLEGAQADPAPVVAEDFDNYAYELKVARLGPLKLIQGFGGRAGREELYDLAADPLEATNLLAEDAAPLSDELLSMADVLRAIILTLATPEGVSGELSAEALEVLRALGYI